MAGPIGPEKPTPGVSRQPVRLDRSKKTSLFEGKSPGNVGNVFEISPDGEVSSGSVASKGFNNGLASYGTPVRVLEIVGDDDLGETICVSLQQESEIDAGFTDGTGATFFPEGPCVGMVEFGAGAGLSFLEFDIPTPTIAPGNVTYPNPDVPGILSISLPVYKRDNGILLTLPASSQRVLVRNDALAPYLINPRSANSGLNANNAGAAKIRVHATYGRRPAQAKLTRSIPICNSSGGGSAPTGNFINGSTIIFGIPPYAVRAWFPRDPNDTEGIIAGTSLSVLINDSALGRNNQVASRGPYHIPLGSDGPIEIFPLDTVMHITNNSPGGQNIGDLTVVFELAI